MMLSAIEAFPHVSPTSKAGTRRRKYIDENSPITPV